MEKFLKRKNEDKIGASPPQKTKFLRKYNPDFIKYGFVNGGSEAEPRAQCVECGLTLSNENLTKNIIIKLSNQNIILNVFILSLPFLWIDWFLLIFILSPFFVISKI